MGLLFVNGPMKLFLHSGERLHDRTLEIPSRSRSKSYLFVRVVIEYHPCT